MFEKETPFIVPTIYGEVGLEELLTRGQITEDDDCNGCRMKDLCDDCNWPGGCRQPNLDAINRLAWDFTQVNKFTEHKQDSMCRQSTEEKTRCPSHAAWLRDLMCTTGRCASMKCERCKGRGRTGRLRMGELVTVNGQVAFDTTDGRGNKMQVLVAQRRVGRYLGMEPGGLLRFEVLSPRKGTDFQSGMRFWLHPSGVYIEDLDAAMLEALSLIDTSLVLPEATGIPGAKGGNGDGR